jgi:hypothetical protein
LQYLYVLKERIMFIRTTFSNPLLDGPILDCACSPFASPCAVHALDAGVLVCMLASTSALSVMLTERKLMRMPCTICTSEMRSSRQWTSLTNIERSFTVPTDPSCRRRRREHSRLCVYCSGPISTRASPQVLVQNKKLA